MVGEVEEAVVKMVMDKQAVDMAKVRHKMAKMLIHRQEVDSQSGERGGEDVYAFPFRLRQRHFKSRSRGRWHWHTITTPWSL